MTTELFIVLVALNAVDVAETAYIVAKGGVEANPIIRPLTQRLGVIPGLLAYKLPLLVLVWFYAMQFPVLVALNVVFAAVVVWNAVQIKAVLEDQ